jgi:hypothetical protein
MDRLILVSGLLLFLAGLVGVAYGVGINVPGMMARGATDYSGITAYIIEWLLMMLAGLIFLIANRKKTVV